VLGTRRCDVGRECWFGGSRGSGPTGPVSVGDRQPHAEGLANEGRGHRDAELVGASHRPTLDVRSGTSRSGRAGTDVAGVSQTKLHRRDERLPVLSAT
jgi:hypothetical protein